MITALALVVSAALAAVLGVFVEHDRRWRMLWLALCAAACLQAALVGASVELREAVWAISALAAAVGLVCCFVSARELWQRRRMRRAVEGVRSDADNNAVRRFHGVAESLAWADDLYGWRLVCVCGHEWVDPSIASVVESHEQHVRQLQRLAAIWGIDDNTSSSMTSIDSSTMR